MISGFLKGLKTNIFGSNANTAIGSTVIVPPASSVQDIDMRGSPTGRLGENPLGFSSFSYPSDVTNDAQNGHYLLFYVNRQNRSKFEYKGAAGQGPRGQYMDTLSGTKQQIKKKEWIKTDEPGGGHFEDVIIDSAGMSTNEKVYYQNRKRKNYGAASSSYDRSFNQSSDRRQRASRTGIAAKAKTTTRITDSVAIYLPPNVVDTTAATYNDMQTGMLGFAAAGSLDFMKFVNTGDYDSAAKTLTAGLSTILGESARKAAAALAETLSGSEGGVQLFNRAFGQANNPYLEVLFETMNLRTFTYNFTFAPRNIKERDEVQRIIQLFRFHMAPELQGGQSRFLTLPSEFDIHYMYQTKPGIASENDYYNRIGTCILENCETNYTPDGVKSFADGSPTKITMGLTFKETDMLTKDKIAAGY